jgi:hypothetical protein
LHRNFPDDLEGEASITIGLAHIVAIRLATRRLGKPTIGCEFRETGGDSQNWGIGFVSLLRAISSWLTVS